MAQSPIILGDTTDKAALAADIREALTCAMHGQALPAHLACRLPADLRAVTPDKLHLLTGQKSVIERVIVALYDSRKTVEWPEAR